MDKRETGTVKKYIKQKGMVLLNLIMGKKCALLDVRWLKEGSRVEFKVV